MKIFYDTEFIDDGVTIALISIGMVAEDGRELYRIVDDEETLTRAVDHDWLRANVVPSLPLVVPTDPHRAWDFDTAHADWPNVQQRPQVAEDVRAFIGHTPQPELWAWYGAYDHVVLAQLFGRMNDLPDSVPMWTNDLKQEVVRLGNPRLAKQHHGTEHNALADARWVRDAYLSLSVRAPDDLTYCSIRRGAQHLASQPCGPACLTEGEPMTDRLTSADPPPDFLDEILKCAEALASARIEAFRAADWGDSTAAAKHADDAAGHRLALAVLVSAERAAGVDEGQRHRETPDRFDDLHADWEVRGDGDGRVLVGRHERTGEVLVRAARQPGTTLHLTGEEWAALIDGAAR